jgi:hypothetical protein
MRYQYDVHAVIYDEVTSDVPHITKINGINSMYSALRGRGLYKNKNSLTILKGENISGTPAPFSQDLCEQVLATHGIPYTWDNSLKSVFQFGKVFRTYYGQLHSKATILYNRSLKPAYDITTQAIEGPAISTWYVDHNVLYFYKEIDSYTNIGQISGIRNLNADLLDGRYSVIAVYHLTSGNNHQFLVKPIGIDMLYMDWIDTAKYDLLRIQIGRDRYPRMSEIDLATTSSYPARNITRIPKNLILDDNSRRVLSGRNSLKAQVEFKFALRDKVTNKIGFLTEQSLKIGPAKRNSPVDLRIE